MNKIKGFVKEFGVSVLALALPMVVAAQTAPPTGGLPGSPINTVGGVTSIICTVVAWLFYLLIVAAIVFVLIAAFRYLTAAGDPEKVKAAGATLLYAAIAVIVALIAKGIPLIAANFIGGTGFTAC